MSKYPPPIANLPIFDPQDFNTTLNNGTPLSNINSIIDQQLLTTNDLTTTISSLFNVANNGTNLSNLVRTSTLTNSYNVNTSNYMGTIPGVVNQTLANGTYLVNYSTSIQTTAPITSITAYVAANLTASSPSSTRVFYYENNTPGSVDIEGSAIVETTSGSIYFLLYVTSTSVGNSYKYNVTNGGKVYLNCIKLK